MVTSGTSGYGELCPLTVQQVNGYIHCLKTHQPGLITRAVFWMDVILQYLKIGRKKSKPKLGISRKYEEQKRYRVFAGKGTKENRLRSYYRWNSDVHKVPLPRPNKSWLAPRFQFPGGPGLPALDLSCSQA